MTKKNKNNELRADDRVEAGAGEGRFVALHYVRATAVARLE